MRMSTTHDQGMTATGTCCNWIAFCFAIFAACSPWWTWGYYVGETTGDNNHNPYGSPSVSASPWIAGYVWKTIPVNVCDYCAVVVDLLPVQWANIPASSACGNTSSPVYTMWSGPYGYCGASTPQDLVFEAPSNPIATQGLIIAACAFLLVTGIVGCVDTCISDDKNFLAMGATFLSFTSMIMLICAFSVWADWNWVKDVQNGATAMPIWLNKDTNSLGAVNTVMVLGPGWGCTLFAFILTMFSTCLHGASMGVGHGSTTTTSSDKEDIPNIPPAKAEPVPAQPVVNVSMQNV